MTPSLAGGKKANHCSGKKRDTSTGEETKRSKVVVEEEKRTLEIEYN